MSAESHLPTQQQRPTPMQFAPSSHPALSRSDRSSLGRLIPSFPWSLIPSSLPPVRIPYVLPNSEALRTPKNTHFVRIPYWGSKVGSAKPFGISVTLRDSRPGDPTLSARLFFREKRLVSLLACFAALRKLSVPAKLLPPVTCSSANARRNRRSLHGASLRSG